MSLLSKVTDKIRIPHSGLPRVKHWIFLSGEHENVFLAHQIERSYILPHLRNSYLTLVISPQAHPVFKCSFLKLVV